VVGVRVGSRQVRAAARIDLDESGRVDVSQPQARRLDIEPRSSRSTCCRRPPAPGARRRLAARRPRAVQVEAALTSLALAPPLERFGETHEDGNLQASDEAAVEFGTRRDLVEIDDHIRGDAMDVGRLDRASTVID
jgi:hypothetical protein